MRAPLTDPLAAVRGRIQEALSSRVAGPGRDQAIELIFRSEGERWFTPQDPIWRVHSDPSMYVGGIRALLMQALHPLAMAGVAGHSGFRGDPWGRLQRTSYYISMTTFGPVTEAERLLARIRGIHRQVKGADPAGRAFAANDPHLLEWVHCAEADSFLTAHTLLAATPLTPAQADTYVAQIGSVNARLGFESAPASVAELRARLAAFTPELEAGEAARDTIRFLLDEPPLPPYARPVYEALAAGAVASLPDWAYTLMDVRAGRWRRSSTALRTARAATSVIRWAIDHPAHSTERGGRETLGS